jgi:DNA-binding GntR family transcriptional regulator
MSKRTASRATTNHLVTRLNAIRAELGDSWRPGWVGIVDAEAAAIIEALLSRDTDAAREALADHGIQPCEVCHKEIAQFRAPNGQQGNLRS